jgi:hypothetical protein
LIPIAEYHSIKLQPVTMTISDISATEQRKMNSLMRPPLFHVSTAARFLARP